MGNIDLTMVFEPAQEGGYIAYVEEIPGINSQGESLEEAKENLTDAMNIVFEEFRTKAKQTNTNSSNTVKQKLTFTL